MLEVKRMDRNLERLVVFKMLYLFRVILNYVMYTNAEVRHAYMRSYIGHVVV